MSVRVTPFLMFAGSAAEAAAFYADAFPDGAVEIVTRAGEDEFGRAIIRVGGQEMTLIDSPAGHGITFTPALSFFVTCATPEEVDALFAALSDGGKVLMPLDLYPFSRRFGWVEDRFGVSWQIGVGD